MNTHTITLPAALAALTISAALIPGCAPLKEHIRDAVQDLDVQGIAQEHACGLYISEGRKHAEQIYAHDWPLFAPVFETPPNAAADLQWCMGSLQSLGIQVLSKHRSESSTAVCDVVMFGAGFESRPVEEQAATCMHEAAHIYEQKRVGCKPWLLSYAKVSGRMSSEGTAYALYSAALERYGVPRESVERKARAQARRFPTSYGLARVLSSGCAEDYFAAIRRALRERAGV
jgi:hypothetical protein